MTKLTKKTLSIGILGAGAVGLAVYHLLHESGFLHLDLLSSRDEKRSWQLRRGSDCVNYQTDLYHSGGSKAHETHFDIIFVCLKAFDLQTVLTSMAQSYKSTHFCILANGLHIDLCQLLKKKFPGHQFYLGSSSIGSKWESPLLSVSGSGQIIFEDFGIARLIVESQSSNSFGIYSLIQEILMKKWVFNLCINSLTAAYRLPRNGDIDFDRSEVYELFQEGIKYLALKYQFHANAGELWEEMQILVDKTSENENSMAKDVRLSRQNESDFFTGVLKQDESLYPVATRLHQQINS